MMVTTAKDLIQKIDAVTLKHLGNELHRMLYGARVSKIMHPNAREFLITFWGHDYDAVETLIPRDNLNLFYINLAPEFCYALLLAPGEKDRLLKTTLHHPTSVCMLLRKHLGNAKVLGVFTLPDERVLNIRFENFNELGNRVSLVLSLELMGKHSNMMLYDELTQEIFAISHSVSEQMSQYRELTVGSSYAPPPRDLAKRPLLGMTEEAFVQRLLAEPDVTSDVNTLSDWFAKHFAGFGKMMVSQAIQPVLPTVSGTPLLESQIRDMYQILSALYDVQIITPTISKDGRSFALTPLEDGQLFDSVHAMLRTYFIAKTEERRQRHYAKQLISVVDSAEKRRQKREQTLTPMSAEEIETLQEAGHLLLATASAGELPPRPQKGIIELPDFYTGALVTLEVDPSLNWAENADQYYRRAKKSKARQAQYELQHAALTQEQQFLAELRVMLEQADSMKDLQAIEADLVEQGLMKSSVIELGKQKKQVQKNAGILTLTLEDGTQLLIGRTSQANGELVGRLGKPNDWWVHVHQMPGSHVLVKLPQEQSSLTNDLILRMTNLAVHFSSARDSKNVPVVYTQIKHVRKIPGSYPGHVTYKQEQSVFITAEPELISGLLVQDKRPISHTDS